MEVCGGDVVHSEEKEKNTTAVGARSRLCVGKSDLAREDV